MEKLFDQFESVWSVDFEYTPIVGESPGPICMVARELKTNKTFKYWEDELRTMAQPPFPIGKKSLFVSYYAPAEFSCFHALGWHLPKNVLDLFVEFRNQTNVHMLRNKANLLSALLHYGLDALTYEEKESMREIAIRGGPFTPAEKAALLDYCESDVAALQKLLPMMLPHIDLPYALNRGRYMKAVSIIEKNGTPLDAERLMKLKQHWEAVKGQLVERIDKDFGVFEGQTFKRERFEQYLVTHNLSWPRSESGALMLDEDTFREMARTYPQIAPIKELRHSLSQLRLSGLTVGRDGRNRTSVSPFRATTGRNQPSNAEFIFGPSCWLRGLIKPPPDHCIVYLDWSQQEFGIAAALSNDKRMKDAYLSGDPYLAFAKQAGAAPPEATKKTHSHVREQFKACVLAVQYGMGSESLAARINQPRIQGRNLLQLHRETYPAFWNWSDAAVNQAMLTSKLQTTFGWTVHIQTKANDRSLRNFPMQANGAEMLRLACCLMVEAGIEVCAPVHDAILIVAQKSEVERTVKKAKQLMEDASAIILDGFRLRSDEKVIAYPDRYMDERGEKMWNTVWEIVDELETEAEVKPKSKSSEENMGQLSLF
jgi:DNA polymerase-1